MLQRPPAPAYLIRVDFLFLQTVITVNIDLHRRVPENQAGIDRTMQLHTRRRADGFRCGCPERMLLVSLPQTTQSGLRREACGGQVLELDAQCEAQSVIFEEMNLVL